jgi:hypothetical protein
MRIHVDIDGRQRKASLAHREATTLQVDGACPACGVSTDGVFSCIGKADEQTKEHDRILAPALALCCKKHVGMVVVVFSTIFGLEEDDAVLHGRPRVY